MALDWGVLTACLGRGRTAGFPFLWAPPRVRTLRGETRSDPQPGRDTREGKREPGAAGDRGDEGNLAPRSELGGAAGVALQQAHDGRVALGSADELLEGQLACGERERCRGKAAPARGGRAAGGGRRVAPAPAPHRRYSCPFGGRFSPSSSRGSTRPPASSSPTKPSCKWPGGREGKAGVRGGCLSTPHPHLQKRPQVHWRVERGSRGGGTGGPGRFPRSGVYRRGPGPSSVARCVAEELRTEGHAHPKAAAGSPVGAGSLGVAECRG